MRARRWGLGVACVVPLVLCVGNCVTNPGTACTYQPLGDEGEGECLGLVARAGTFARCRVADAVLREADAGANDVVLTSALDGFVAAAGCDDLAYVWAKLPSGSAGYVDQIVGTKYLVCLTPGMLATDARVPSFTDEQRAAAREAATRSSCASR